MNEEELLKVLKILIDDPEKQLQTDESLESIALHWTGMTLEEICKEVNSD